MWLEYHSFATDQIYMAIVTKEEDLSKLQSLNLVIGSAESYCSYSGLIKIAMQGGMCVPSDNIDVVVKMRMCMCSTIAVIENYDNTIIKD